MARQLGYKHTLSKFCVRKNTTCLSVGLWKIGRGVLSHVKLCIGGLRKIAVL